MEKPRIKLPDTVRAGEVIDVKTVITHPMETGNRRDAAGKPIARNIIHTMVARFEGREVFRAEPGSGLSANPYLSFPMKVTGPGVLEVEWIDDEGQRATEKAEVKITG